MRERTVGDTMYHHAFKAALLKVAAASRRLRGGRRKGGRRLWLPGPAAKVASVPPPPDPVKLAVLAMESFGRASMRASFTGIEVKVVVPDDATAQIFRAALSETIRTRPTDKLVRVVID